MSKIHWLVGVQALFLAAVASPAEAAPKFMNGGECQMFYSLAAGWYDTSGLYNKSGAGAWTTCPLVRLTTTNTNGLADLKVAFNSGAGGTGFSCYGYSVSTTGSVLIMQSVTLPSQPNQETTANFGNTVNVSNTTSSYAVSCYVANNAIIRGVRYSE